MGGTAPVCHNRAERVCGSAGGSGNTKRYVATLLTSMLLCSASPALAGPAIGQFEMKQVETEAGDIEFQSQNAYGWGQPARRYYETSPGEYAYDDNTVAEARNALEIEVSPTDWFRFRLGIEYEKERLDEPADPVDANAFDSLKLDEYAAEAVVVLVPIKGDGLGLAWLTEFEKPVDNSEPMTINTGPLIEAKQGSWRFLLNLFATHFFGGDPEEPGMPTDDKWDFNYAAQAKYDFSEEFALALEAYGTVDRIGNTGTPSEEAVLFGDFNQHRIGPVFYYEMRLDKFGAGGAGGDDKDDEGTIARFGVGLLAGLNENTPDGTLKLSLEIDF